MGAIAFALGIAALFALTPILLASRLPAVVAEANEDQLRDLRSYGSSRWTEYLLVIWAAASLTGAVALLLRGHSIGWAWIGVAAAYAAAIIGFRRGRAAILDALGDRGIVERSGRYVTRLAHARRWALAGLCGYGTVRVLEAAHPTPSPEWMSVLIAIGTVAALTGAAGWLIVRTQMYLAGDDLAPKGE